MVTMITLYTGHSLRRDGRMIIREAPLDNAWYRVAVAWFIALAGINGVLWPAYDYYQYDTHQLRWIAYSIPIGSTVFFVIGKFLSEPKRVVSFVAIIGLFGYLPLLIGLMLPLILLLALPDVELGWTIGLILVCVIAAVYWITGEIQALATRMKIKKFVAQEFSISESCIYLNRTPTTDLDAPEISDNLIVHGFARSIPKLIFLLPLAYPLQRFLYKANGVPAVVLLLAILATPLALHVIERLACGFYLWIYTVRKVELQHGKHVILAPNADAATA
jgi:hypothetical protein